MWPFNKKPEFTEGYDHFYNGDHLQFLDRLISEQIEYLTKETHTSLINVSAVTITSNNYQMTIISNTQEILDYIKTSKYYYFLTTEFFNGSDGLQNYIVKKIASALDAALVSVAGHKKNAIGTDSKVPGVETL